MRNSNMLGHLAAWHARCSPDPPIFPTRAAVRPPGPYGGVIVPDFTVAVEQILRSSTATGPLRRCAQATRAFIKPNFEDLTTMVPVLPQPQLEATCEGDSERS